MLKSVAARQGWYLTSKRWLEGSALYQYGKYIYVL